MRDLFTPLPTARQLTDAGIEASTANAERQEPGWNDRALEYFKLYATLHPAFMTEDVRSYAYADGLQMPPAEGAWGGVAREAKKHRYVRSQGKMESKNPSQHGKWMTLWISQIYEEGARRVA